VQLLWLDTGHLYGERVALTRASLPRHLRSPGQSIFSLSLSQP